MVWQPIILIRFKQFSESLTFTELFRDSQGLLWILYDSHNMKDSRGIPSLTRVLVMKSIIYNQVMKNLETTNGPKIINNPISSYNNDGTSKTNP